MNKKIKALLKEKKKTSYGLSLHLGITPQATYNVVNKGKLSDQYERMRKIAEYLECDIEDIID